MQWNAIIYHAIFPPPLGTSAYSVGGYERNLDGMRFRWKRGRPSCRKLLCFTSIAVFIILVCKFINEEGSQFEREWSCEELRAKERLIELVSIISVTRGRKYTKLIRLCRIVQSYSPDFLRFLKRLPVQCLTIVALASN